MNQIKNKCVLMYDDFWFIYAFQHGGKPSPNSCLLLKYLNIRAGDNIIACYHYNAVNHC